MNSKRNNNLDKTKITRFSIRTYKGYGAASIIVSAFFLLLNHNHIAQASEIKKDMNTSTNISHINSEVSSQLQSNNNLQNKNDTILNDANTVSNVQLNNTSTDSNKSLANKLADQHTQQNNVEDTKQNQSSINTQHNSQSPSVRHRIRKRSVNTNLAPASNNDPLHFNETNTSIENGHFDHVTGGTLPTTSQKVTVVTGVDHWTSLSTAPNPEFPIFNTLTAKDYRPFMSDASAPYGVVLARTTDGNNRNVLDPKVAGIYQDISVVPGSELVVRFTSASMTFKSSVTGAKLKISDTTGSQILFDSRLNGMGNFPTGKLTVLVNIPENLNRVRVMFLPISNKSNLTSGQTSSANGFGSAPANIYYGGVVSNVSVNSGAYIETSVPQTSYTVSANSATANAVRATVSFNLENKGHNFAKSVDYKVTLPANSKFISATGAQGSYNQATNVLTLSIGQVGIGQRRTITYTTELQATEPKNVELNGNLTYQTDAPFRGTGIQKTGNNSVNTQTVQILMYQTDLQTKVNDVTQQLHTLNEADYTPESWNALKAKLVDANNILNEENNHIDLANRQNQATINQLTTDIQTLFTQLKETTPASPSVTADVPNANVVVSPQGDTTSMTIKYVDTAGTDQSITAMKANNMWSLNPTVAGISINDQTGTVTVEHTAVQPNSVVKATAVKGNSDSSNEMQVTMPIKEATPAPPTVTADEPTASVVITPQGEITSMTIKYVDTAGADQSITATKANNIWSLNPSVQGITINDQTGIVNVNHTAVQPHSEVKATAVKGNSNVSGENKAEIPVKQVTPLAPTITADVSTAIVLVSPQGDTTSMTIKYVDTAGADQTITATKVNNMWSLNPTVAGMSINDQTGTVTVEHTAVQPNSVVKATAVKGNSDSSSETRVTMPIKEATPAPPTVTADEPTASVVVSPQGDITSMTIKYVDTARADQTITATKINNMWSLNPSVAGMTINDQSGAVTISHTAVQASSEVKATAVKGNSDSSSETRVMMPIKQATPAAPTVAADIPHASVVVTPQGDVTSMTIKYTDMTGANQSITVTKANNIWSLNPSVAGMTINDQSGAVTISHTAVQASSEVIATAVKGNSDVSGENKAEMPVKEATPVAPTVIADVPTASVVVTPQGDITSMTIKYVDTVGTDQIITATKINNMWSLNPSVAGISINNQTGTVTVTHTAVQPHSEVKATAVKGNSDSSSETQVTMPIKETMPTAPTVTADVPTASVVITPQGDITSMTIKYVDTTGADQTITVTKANNMWSLNPSVAGISINNQTGTVTVTHTAVQPHSEVKATAVKGNSDVSGENKDQMPIKEATPAPPNVTADVPTASVVITPQGDITSMTIKYVDTAGTNQTITATKTNNTWSLSSLVQGVSINNQSGVVTVAHTAVQASSEVKATAVKGNSDSSSETQVTMPIKEATPAAPSVTADVPTASVIITPQGDITSMTIKYINPASVEETIMATKNGSTWDLSNTVGGITINNQTGIVTVDHTAVQASSEIKATAVKGNSDVSGENKDQMPIKEATPAAPTVTADMSTASVVITPQGDITSMTIKYVDTAGTDQITTATKVNNTWSLNPSVQGISINDQTGIITVEHTAVQPSSEVKATAVKGNSDSSSETQVTMPVKEATPAPPNVTADEPTASVVITPQGDITSMTIKYVDTAGTD
ncbi:YSIRK signal domain/LPXTG anchor domain surface protein, partial [Staphylococcus simiae]